MRPRLLDLFCGAGGAAMGYHRAGFEVVGVDIRPQPNYPFEFVQCDALEFMAAFNDPERAEHYEDWLPGVALIHPFAAIHASPPCQFFSPLNALWWRDHPNLIPPTRDLLQGSGLPYIIENVPLARRALRDPVTLCGSMFGLGANGRQLRRHRLFECSFFVMRSKCQHRGQPVGVYGHGGGGSMTRGYTGTGPEYQEAMGMSGHTKVEIAQAIPPAYTEHIGHYLMAEINAKAAA